MSSDELVRVAAARVVVPRAQRPWDRFRLGLVVAWVLLALTVPLVGERTVSWDHARQLAAAGELDAVRVSHELPRGAVGFATVVVQWQHGPLHYRTEVVEARGGASDLQDLSWTDGPVVHAAPSDVLTRLDPDLRMTRDQAGYSSGTAAFGWQVPGVVAIAALLLVLLGVGFVIAGPEPWRATRWAWFWLTLPPIGSLVFLLLSGPTPLLPRPRPHARRLTGGWAFLLSLLLAPLVARWRG